MNLSDINWDFNEAGEWPLPIRVAVITIIFLALIGVGFYFDTQPQLDQLQAEETQEAELKRQFEIKQKKAVNLDAYKQQLALIELSLAEMIKQMPTKAEVASLLVDISQTGMASGLEFRLFKPAPPVQRDFYYELPIAIEVVGDYEELGLFVSGLAALPRIVTVHDVAISPRGTKDKPLTTNALSMMATIKTYNEARESEDKTETKPARGQRR